MARKADLERQERKDRGLQTEQDIQTEVLAYLRQQDIFHWRVALGAVKGNHGSKTNPMRGFPDIAGIISRGKYRGTLFALEIKKPGGKVSEEQAIWITDIRASGAKADVVTSVERVADLMENFWDATVKTI